MSNQDDSTPTELVALYQQMYDHTLPECQNSCRAPLSCCSPMYCDITEEWAKDRGVVLPEIRKEGLRFMGEQGCTVPPHLRPLCTLHTCKINSVGFKPDDPKWTREYFTIRSKIDEIEMGLNSGKDH